MKTRTHFTFRVDTWTADGESIVEHVAGVEDYQVALATYHAACERWPGTPITLRQGAHVIEDSRRLRMASGSRQERGRPVGAGRPFRSLRLVTASRPSGRCGRVCTLAREILQ